MDLKCPLSVGKVEPAGARSLRGNGLEGSCSVLVLETGPGPALCSLDIFSLLSIYPSKTELSEISN